MAHRKESVKPEAEIDYQAKKNVQDKLTSVYIKARKKKEKLRKELMATIPGREHGTFGLGYKDTEESKRIKKEMQKESDTLKSVKKHEKYLEKDAKKDKLSSLAKLNKRKLLQMGVYRKTKGGEVLEAPSKSKYEYTNLPSGPREPSVYKGKTFANRYKKKLNYTQ